MKTQPEAATYNVNSKNGKTKKYRDILKSDCCVTNVC